LKNYTSEELKEFVSKPLFEEKIILNKDLNYPKISIVTPSYNQGKFLERTILSVLNQNYPNLEYIIINGGSTDGSVEIIKKYEKYLTYWVSEKDKGMYEAINKGLKIASGDILAYLNSDDLYLPNTIQTVVDYFQKHPEILLIYGDCTFIDAEGDFLYTYHFPNFNWRKFVVLNWSSIPQPATFWRKEVHKKIGYFDPIFKMAGDFDFFARVGKSFRIKHVKKSLAQFRVHNESLTSTNRNIDRKEAYLIHQRYKTLPGFADACLRCLANLQIKLLNLPLMIKKMLKLQ